MARRTINRREFLTASGRTGLGAALLSRAAGASGEWRNKQPGMTYRRLGRTGFMVSAIVMGGNEIRPDNYEHVVAAIDLGLNYLDTAPAYGRGLSEKGFAKVIQARGRDKVFLNTKVSLWDTNRRAVFQKIYDSLPVAEQKKLQAQVEEELERRGILDPDYLGMYNPSSQQREARAAVLADLVERKYGRQVDRRKNFYRLILDSVEESLQRLQTDHLDVMTCPHGASTPTEVTGYPEIFEAFEKLKKDGKVRHLSVSAHNDPAGILRAAMETGVYSMAMIAYNIVNHRWVDEVLSKAKKSDFGVIAMKVARPVHDNRPGRKVDPERVKRIHAAVPGDLDTPRKAYRWALENPSLSAVISNMQNLEQVEANLALVRTGS